MITDRIKGSLALQQILSSFAHIIRIRLGYHELSEYTCSRIGYIFLNVIDDEIEIMKFKNELDKILGIKYKEVVFD